MNLGRKGRRLQSNHEGELSVDMGDDASQGAIQEAIVSYFYLLVS